MQTGEILVPRVDAKRPRNIIVVIIVLITLLIIPLIITLIIPLTLTLTFSLIPRHEWPVHC